MVIRLQRLEGLAVGLAALYFYGETDASWLLFIIIFLVPDFTMIGYQLGNKKLAALLYNLGRSYTLAILALVISNIINAPHALSLSIIWIAHIGFERALGYGLKLEDNFKHTHLGWVGKTSIVSENKMEDYIDKR